MGPKSNRYTGTNSDVLWHTVTVNSSECRFQDTPRKLEEQAGDTAQQLGACIAPLEDWSLVPSAPVGSQSLVTPAPKIRWSLLVSMGNHTHMSMPTHTDT